MKIDIKTEFEDFRSSYELKINDVKALCFWDGEPEDNTLSRNFNDVYNILKVIIEAFEAGRQGENLVITESHKDIGL